MLVDYPSKTQHNRDYVILLVRLLHIAGNCRIYRGPATLKYRKGPEESRNHRKARSCLLGPRKVRHDFARNNG